MKQPGIFSQKVWQLARLIPPGRVTTYGTLAVTAGGHPMMSRMITSILSKAPDQENIPYHRIVYADGRVWLDPQNIDHRLELYKKEGIRLDSKHRIIDFEKIIYVF